MVDLVIKILIGAGVLAVPFGAMMNSIWPAIIGAAVAALAYGVSVILAMRRADD